MASAINSTSAIKLTRAFVCGSKRAEISNPDLGKIFEALHKNNSPTQTKIAPSVIMNNLYSRSA